jgi:hypothetical protein
MDAIFGARRQVAALQNEQSHLCASSCASRYKSALPFCPLFYFLSQSVAKKNEKNMESL